MRNAKPFLACLLFSCCAVLPSPPSRAAKTNFTWRGKGGELAAIERAREAYWAAIRDGRGRVTETEYWESYNTRTEKDELVRMPERRCEWKFSGERMLLTADRPGLWGCFVGDARYLEIPLEDILWAFDGRTVTAGRGKSFVLRKPGPDFLPPRGWDPRRHVTMGGREAALLSEGGWRFAGTSVLDGRRCLVAEKTDERSNVRDTLRCWFDTERNCCVIKSEMRSLWTGKTPPADRDRTWASGPGPVLGCSSTVNLREYAKGLWGPRRVEETNWAPEAGGMSVAFGRREWTYDDSCAYNVGLTEKDFAVTFPEGAEVMDASRYPVAYASDPPKREPYPRPKTSLELRPPADSGIPAKPDIAGKDILGAWVEFEGWKAAYLDVVLSPQGGAVLDAWGKAAMRFGATTKLAILVDGRVVCEPVTLHRWPARGAVQLEGPFTARQLDRIFGPDWDGTHAR